MAKRIEKLTPEQKARIPEFWDEWLKIGLSTEIADRPRAEAGVKLAYGAAGLKPPSLVIWLDSPMAGAMGAALLSGTAKAGKQVGDQVWAQVGAQVRDQVRAQVRDQVRAQVGVQVGVQVGAQVWTQVRAQVRAQVWAQVGAQVRDQVRAQVGVQVGVQVGDQVWAQVGAQVRDQVRAQVRAQVGVQAYLGVYGQHESGWLSWIAYFAEACGVKEGARLHGINEVAKSCGWWWPFEGAVILTERPTQIHRNAEHRLHNDAGPALLYPDGWGIWALNGLGVDRKIVEAPETLTAKEVRDERNAEIRRHMLDRYKGLRGAAAQGAWIADLGLKPISSEDITDKLQPAALTMWKLSHGDKPCECKLYKAKVPDDEDLAILMVTCTSTLKEVSLRVPPTIKTARAAREWTFGGAKLAEAVET